MRESVVARRCRPAHGEKLRAVVAQGVTQIVQPGAMDEVAVKQACDMALRRECLALFVHPILGSQAANHPNGDELTKLIENDRPVLGRFWLFFALASLVGSRPEPTTF